MSHDATTSSIPEDSRRAGDDDALATTLSTLSLRVSAAQELLDDALTILAEVDEFVAFLTDQGRLHSFANPKTLRNNVENEVRQLTGIIAAERERAAAEEEEEEAAANAGAETQTAQQPDDRIAHSVSSSNVPFFRAVWNVAKLSRSVTSIRRVSPSVDVVADGGSSWVKVSTVSDRRLLLEMAKAGWDWAADESGDENENDSSDEDAKMGDDDEHSDIGILKIAHKLLQSARETRVNYRSPTVTLVLPRIHAHADTHIDALLDKLRARGVTVVTADAIPPTIPPIAQAKHSMQYDEFARFTPVLNVDCTILLALVSDISHAAIAEQAWFNWAIRRQLELEDREKLLPSQVFPALAGHELVAAEAAVLRMREITMQIGTPTEQLRMEVILGTGPYADSSSEALVAALAEQSRHQVPASLRLPIRSLAEPSESTMSTLPEVAKDVASTGVLVDVNWHVFLYGWASGLTTVTSNGTVAKAVEGAVEKWRVSQQKRDDDQTSERWVVGPNVWVCRTSRSLLAKEKGRKDQRFDLR